MTTHQIEDIELYQKNLAGITAKDVHNDDVRVNETPVVSRKGNFSWLHHPRRDIMSLSEDEALLNSDDLPEYEGNAMLNENSVTAIISEDSEEMDVEDEQEEDEEVPQGNSRGCY